MDITIIEKNKETLFVLSQEGKRLAITDLYTKRSHLSSAYKLGYRGDGKAYLNKNV